MSSATKALVVLLALYVLDFLLLTPIGLETRPESDVTGLGYAVVIFWIVGVALAVVSIGLIFKRSNRTPAFVTASALLSVPTVLADQARLIHANNPPTLGITLVELVQLVVAFAVVALALGIGSPNRSISVFSAK